MPRSRLVSLLIVTAVLARTLTEDKAAETTVNYEKKLGADLPYLGRGVDCAANK